MKRFYLITGLLLVLVIAAFTGCDKKQVVQSDSATSSGSISQQAASGTESQSTSDELKSIYFNYKKSDLRAGDKEILKSNAKYLLKNKNAKIIIEGNCDERGSDAVNMSLGDKRAKEAMKYLVSLGVDKKRIKTTSYGKKRPVDSGHDEDAWAKNRRDDFVLNTK
jgi:peptidoglycan-associated lipoprotein